MTVADPLPIKKSGPAPTLDLKRSLMLRVATVAIACFLIMAALALYGIFRDVRQVNESVADIVVKQMDMQLFRIEMGTEATTRFPDWDPIIEAIQQPGQCLIFVRPDASIGRSNCIGFVHSKDEPPQWFAALYDWLPPGWTDVTRPVVYQGRSQGKLQVTSTRAAVVATVWKQVSNLLGLTTLLVAAICILQYIAISRALRPTKEILTGLDGLARGDLTCRLPNFKLVELQRISEVFNTLAANLDRTTREKQELAAKLVDSQEQERLHLARDLHDELAQGLSALSAMAASIKATAEKEAPSLVPEAKNISNVSTGIMQSLRRTLQTLRPPEIDDLGLAASLGALARDQERRSGGELEITLGVEGDLASLPATAASHVYRIVQEGLTNISKHAHATKARVALGFRPRPEQQAGSGKRWLALTIEDNGRGGPEGGPAAAGTGLGLIGMRERVAALGGKLDIIDADNRGFMLQAMIPI